MHEDLNRVINKPYVEMKDYDNRPDSEIADEHWKAFLARNQSIIVDLMYGQLKSTVQCLECGSISITFDPFLTMALPIARPFKVTVVHVATEIFANETNFERKPNMVLSIALNKDSTVADLQ